MLKVVLAAALVLLPVAAQAAPQPVKRMMPGCAMQADSRTFFTYLMNKDVEGGRAFLKKQMGHGMCRLFVPGQMVEIEHDNGAEMLVHEVGEGKSYWTVELIVRD